MGIFLKNGKYWIDYSFNGCRKRECIGPNRSQAEAALESRKLEAFLQKSLTAKKVTESPYFEDFANEYIEYSREKKRSWKRDLIVIKSATPHFRRMRMDDITPGVVAEYKVKRADEVKPATVNRELACLRRMFHLAMQWGKTGSNPVEEVKALPTKKRLEKILSDEEAERLISSARGYTRGIIIMALNTGMKLGEILSLKWEDVDLAEGIITVSSYKKERGRKIPINTTVLELLRKAKRLDSPYVFADPQTGQPFRKIEKSFKSAVARAGLHGCTFHDLRHSFGKRLVENGVDLLTVKELLGHSTLEATRRYLESTPEKKKAAVELAVSSILRQKALCKPTALYNEKAGSTPTPQLQSSPKTLNN